MNQLNYYEPFIHDQIFHAVIVIPVNCQRVRIESISFWPHWLDSKDMNAIYSYTYRNHLQKSLKITNTSVSFRAFTK